MMNANDLHGMPEKKKKAMPIIEILDHDQTFAFVGDGGGRGKCCR